MCVADLYSGQQKNEVGIWLSSKTCVLICCLFWDHCTWFILAGGWRQHMSLQVLFVMNPPQSKPVKANLSKSYLNSEQICLWTSWRYICEEETHNNKLLFSAFLTTGKHNARKLPIRKVTQTGNMGKNFLNFSSPTRLVCYWCWRRPLAFYGDTHN